MDLGLTGKRALVLGASSGLGAAIATALDAEGARVAIVGRRAEVLHEQAEELTDAVDIVADLTAPGAAQVIVDEAIERLGSIDIVVLNGGGPPPGTAADVTGESAEHAVGLLVTPQIEIVNAVLPSMRERGWGRILAVGSGGIHQPIPNLALSNLGRSALAAYLKTLATQVAPWGVTVNMVLPGRIQTDRLRQLDEAAAESSGTLYEEAREKSMAAIPIGRYGTPEEFAALAAFLASEAAAYVTGTEVRCDGGLVQGR